MPEIRILDKNSEIQTLAEAKQLAGKELAYIYFEDFDNKTFKAEIFRLALFDESGRLQALSIIKIPQDSSLAEISCFKAISEEAFDKFSEALLFAAEKILKEKNCSVACCFYDHEIESPRAKISYFFEKHGYSTPTIIYLKYYFDCYSFRPKWFTREMTLGKGFEIFPWKELSSEEEKQLLQKESQFTFHPFISPLLDRKNQQDINSLGLKVNGHIIGWMITHTLPFEKEFVRYSAFYIDPKYQHQGLAIPLLKLAIQKQQQSKVQWSYFTLNLQYTEKDWLKFCEKRLAPYTTKIIEVIRRCKAFR